MKKILLSLAFVLTLGTAQAEISASHRAAIEKLITASQVQKQISSSMSTAMDSMMGGSADQMAALPPAQQEKFKGAVAKMKALVSEALSWEKLKNDVTEVYAKHYTEQEAQDVTKLLESPAGQTLLTKQLAMTGDMMVVTEGKIKALTPQLMQVMQEEMQK
ncbi:MAG: DUF2059 domain-containing protein [Verrucomicrobiaceae bacterium]|nr:DUF2059 domain-containing protein [Verrucomicrobiaceae bacterium]